MCSSVQPVCSYTHVDFRIWNLVVVALKSVSFARLKVTAFVWSVGSPWSRWSNPRSAQMWSRLAPFTQQRVNIRGVDSVGSCVRAFTHNSPTAITQAPEAKETLAAAGGRLWQQVAAKKPPRTWNLLFLQVQTHTDKDQEDQDRDQAGVLWLWGQRGGRRRGGSGRWRAGEEQLQDQVLWLWRPERERQWRWELSAEREKGQESSCSTGLSQLQRGQPSYQRLSGQPSQQQHWSVVLVNMQNLCPALQSCIHRCPLSRLQFDFPTDAFDFSDEPSPGATEGHKGRPGKSSDKSKDTGTGLKKIFSGPKKVLERFIICLFCSNEVTWSSVWVSLSVSHVHLKLLRQPSSHVYFSFICPSEQLAYTNRAKRRVKTKH